MQWARMARALLCSYGALASWGCADDEDQPRPVVLVAKPQQAGTLGVAPTTSSPAAGASPAGGGAAGHAAWAGATTQPATAGAPSPAAMQGAAGSMGIAPPAMTPPSPTTPPAAAIQTPSVSFAVSDLDKSVAFYTGPMGMTRVAEITYADRVEVVLKAHAGPALFGLMKYTDGSSRNVKNVPAKLIFAVTDTQATAQSITAAGYKFQIPGIIASDPDGYGAELLAQPGADRSIVAVGLFVSEYMKSIDFYVKALGMMAAQDTGVGGFMEKVMIGGGLAHGILIMHYDDGVPRNYKDNPVILSFAVPDAAAALMRVETSGQKIVAQPMPVTALANARVGVAKDPDGYMLQFVQR